MGNLLSASRVFRKRVNRQSVINYLDSEIDNIEKVYGNVLKKEFGMNDRINIK